MWSVLCVLSSLPVSTSCEVGWALPGSTDCKVALVWNDHYCVYHQETKTLPLKTVWSPVIIQNNFSDTRRNVLHSICSTAALKWFYLWRTQDWRSQSSPKFLDGRAGLQAWFLGYRPEGHYSYICAFRDKIPLVKVMLRDLEMKAH